MRNRVRATACWLIVTLITELAQSAPEPIERDAPEAADARSLPLIPIGLDAYRMWDRWPYQRIGARASMRSTYDRRGGNETADASHFLYQVAEDFNVTLDVEGPGVLYFVRTNHWHGSPWHYEIDGVDHIVQESTTADPTRKLDHSVFLPEHLFPNPLTWTYAITKGADLMWVPMPFERRFRLAYSRTFYGTGYYVYHHYMDGANLSQPIRAWDGRTPPADDVLELLRAAGTDIAPRAGGPGADVRERSGSLHLPAGESALVATLDDAPAMVRALTLRAPREHAVALGRGRILITWDERPSPSIDAPIALFFGTGTLHNRDGKEYLVKALPASVRFDERHVRLACYFPMPFFKTARIELEGPPGESIPGVGWTVRTQAFHDPPQHVAYFHATYRDHGVPRPGVDNEFLDTSKVEGGGDWSGSFVGTSFTFSDRAVLTTLEGDPRFFFDDSQTPQAYGTGTEEWGGGGDYWGGRTMTLPLAGHPVGVRRPEDAREPEELIQSAYRFLLADLMPFGKRAVIRLEHGGTNESVERYRSVTYWYGLPAPSLVLTDVLDIGDAESERAHAYSSPDASEPYELTSRYEWGVDHRAAGDDPSAVLAEPTSYAEFEFSADAGTRYFIWIRGTTAGGNLTDATWLQFDELIGTSELGTTYASEKGFGNWRDLHEANEWAWSSSLPQSPPQSVTFARSGRHRLRVQSRHGPHRIDRIWLSATQTERPPSSQPRASSETAGSHAEIVLEAAGAVKLAGGFAVVDEPAASSGKALAVPARSPAERRTIEVYPAHREVGRTTTSFSEFTLRLRSDNLGVLLRRTLDYAFPNQRAVVRVADTEGEWRDAGVWYLAGSNTCYHSYPREDGELGRSRPVVQTSNRRFRDDEILLPRRLAEGRTEIRVRVELAPVRIPLLPGNPVPPPKWSEIRYAAYSYVMPAFSPR